MLTLADNKCIASNGTIDHSRMNLGGGISEEVVVAYSEVLSRHLTGRTEEKHDKPQSGYPHLQGAACRGTGYFTNLSCDITVYYFHDNDTSQTQIFLFPSQYFCVRRSISDMSRATVSFPCSNTCL